MGETSSAYKLSGKYSFDVWFGSSWVGMAIGDTPEEARNSYLEYCTGEHHKEVMLIPFFGLRTSQSTFRHLTGLMAKPEVVSALEQEVSPEDHGCRTYDVWINDKHMGSIEGESPRDAREKANQRWVRGTHDRVILVLNYGVEFCIDSVYQSITGKLINK
jgi:hypothetical protein